ncbi:hypothetical protein SDC9_204453 [bioreactor metagenome]|uniref:Uncharacterized protein n=1 Tax=bioreactor metagenome TaxID=1076179 RepID=A0A645IZL1_9ZZZZ
MEPAGTLAEGADGFRVAAMTDQDHQGSGIGQSGLFMDPLDQRTSRVDDFEMARPGGGFDLGGDPVGTENHRAARGNLIEIADHPAAASGQIGDDRGVVDDFVQEPDRADALFQRGVDQRQCAAHPRTEATLARQMDHERIHFRARWISL